MDIFSIRLANLDLIVDAVYGGKRVRLAEALDRQSSTVSRYWSKTPGNRRTVNKVTARKIEEIIGKPSGWMDVQHASFDEDLDSVVTESDTDEKKLLRLYKAADTRGKDTILTLAKHEADRAGPLAEFPETFDGGKVKDPTGPKGPGPKTFSQKKKPTKKK